MQCLGGNGYINGNVQYSVTEELRLNGRISGLEYPTGRFLRDARLYTVGAGTQEIRRMLIGREFNQEFGTR